MKKVLQLITICTAMFFGTGAYAQSFFETVTFTGALSPNSSEDWTSGWTEWDPQNKVYGAPTDSVTLNAINSPNAVNISGTKVLSITSDLVLNASTVYKMQGFIVIADGAKLTIPAGTVIRGLADKANGNYASLIIRPGAKVYVNGTSTNPVVMTSAKAVGSRGLKDVQGKVLGDWGGFVVLGKGLANQTTSGTSLSLEGFSDAQVTSLGVYGGNDAADSSGSIKFLRIEFAGLDFAANKELNSFTLGAVGSKTVIDHVQASFGGDDAFEWFGGSVNCKHLIAYATADDDFDADFGYNGKVQFGIGVKDSSRFDVTWSNASGASTSEGFEIDNDANGSSLTPITAPEFKNFTMIGPIPVGVDYSSLSATTKGAFRRGARLRRNSAASITNSIFSGYRNVLMIDGNASLANAGVSATPTYTTTSQFKNNLIWKAAGVSATSTLTGQSSDFTSYAAANGLVEVATGTNHNTTFVNLNKWIRGNSSNGVLIDSTLSARFSKANLFVNPKVGSGFDVRPKSDDRFQVGTVAGIISNQGEFVESSSFLYPNPTEDLTYIQVGSVVSTSATVSIFDISGAELKKFDTYIVSGTNNILVDGLESGSYIVKLATAKGSVASFKLMKF